MKKQHIILIIATILLFSTLLAGCTGKDYIIIGFENNKNTEIAIAYDINDGNIKEYITLDGNSDDSIPSDDLKLEVGKTHTIAVSWANSPSESIVNSETFTISDDTIFTIHENGSITKS